MPEIRDPPQRRLGYIARIVAFVFKLLQWLVFSLLFSIVIEWIGMAFWWEGQGLAHSRQMLVNELTFLELNLQKSLLTQDPLRYAKWVIETMDYWLFEFTQFNRLIDWVSQVPDIGAEGVRVWLYTGYRFVAVPIQAALQITQVFAVRLAILTLAMPVFVLFGLVALVDGLVRRDLRRWSGGRESSFVYHYAKNAALPLWVATWVIYLALPVSIHPAWVILPFACLFALALTVTVGTFKKYL